MGIAKSILRLIILIFFNAETPTMQNHHHPVYRLPVRKYFCVHCYSANNLDFFSSESIENVYGHWLSNHTELPVALPFQFYAVDLVGCSYCRFSGYYGKVNVHHQERHPDEPFVCVRAENRQQCAMCHYSGADILSHFEQSHGQNYQTSIFNPNCFTQELLANLFMIDIHKKRRCNYCGDSFETDHEVKMHSFVAHANLNASFVESNDEQPNEISYLICALCDGKFAPAGFLNHIDGESKIWAQRFSGQSVELYRSYMKTKVVFANGLVAFKQNLVFSPYDDSKQIQEMIQRGAQY